MEHACARGGRWREFASRTSRMVVLVVSLLLETLHCTRIISHRCSCLWAVPEGNSVTSEHKSKAELRVKLIFSNIVIRNILILHIK